MLTISAATSKELVRLTASYKPLSPIKLSSAALAHIHWREATSTAPLWASRPRSISSASVLLEFQYSPSSVLRRRALPAVSDLAYLPSLHTRGGLERPLCG